MIATECVRKTHCRASGRELTDVLELGSLHLNAFPLPNELDTDRYPLILSYAQESDLVQLRHTVDPNLMFRTYWYNSGTNESMVRHLQYVARRAESFVAIEPGDMVVDIGCNDGTLLRSYRQQMIDTVGFDPSKIEPEGVNYFVNDFFSRRSWLKNCGRGGQAKVVTSIAMMYDVDDPIQFAMDVAHIMTDDGIWVMEMHYLPTMLELNEFDAICHEHLTYFSLTSLDYVVRRAGMTIVHAEFNDTNGGSMLVVAKKDRAAIRPSAIQNIIISEHAEPTVNRLIDFAHRVKDIKRGLRCMLEQISMEGKTVYGYGASTKGNTLLQYCELTPELLPKIAERNSQKWGRETVGTRIPIVSEEQMREERPDYLLALPYHFVDVFKEREKDLLSTGTKFIVPVPYPKVIE